VIATVISTMAIPSCVNSRKCQRREPTEPAANTRYAVLFDQPSLQPCCHPHSGNQTVRATALRDRLVTIGSDMVRLGRS
jgi:hypothetical protein